MGIFLYKPSRIVIYFVCSMEFVLINVFVMYMERKRRTSVINPFSGKCSILIAPENSKKHLVFSYFQGVAESKHCPEMH